MQTIIKNCGFKLSFELTNNDNTPLDCSNLSVKLVIKKDKTLADNTGLTYTYTNSDTNILNFQFSNVQTAALDTGKYIAGLKVIRSNGMNEEVWNDEVNVIQGVVNE